MVIISVVFISTLNKLLTKDSKITLTVKYGQAQPQTDHRLAEGA